MENHKSNLVTVAIPCYNHAQYISQSIQSIIDQDYENIELVIIDDGSKDDSVEIIKKFIPICKKRFKRFEFIARSNKGLCITLNESIEWSQGKYFSATASDDLLHPKKISEQVRAFIAHQNNKELVGIFTGLSVIDEHGNVLYVRGRDSYFGFKEVIRRTAFMPGCAAMFLTIAMKQVGGYNPSYKIEDLYLALKLSNRGGKFLSIKQPLVFYRRHDDNLSSKSELIWNAVEEILNEYKEDYFYKQGLACSLLIQAHDLQKNSKKKSLLFGGRALKIYPLIIFSRSFFWWFLKFFKL